jgi:hypothetical protein
MKKVVYAVLAFVPVVAFAQSTINTSALDSIVKFIGKTVNSLIPIMIGLAIVYFFWGLVTYIRAAGDPKAQDAGKSHMIWGIIAIAVMVSLFGIVNWLQNLFGITNPTDTITPPKVQGLP